MRIAGCSLGDRALFGELPFGLACAMGSVSCIKDLRGLGFGGLGHIKEVSSRKLYSLHV